MKKVRAKIFEICLSKCSGCRACEIACSFHFNKEFDPAISVIHVHRDIRNGEIEITIKSSCDFCEQEDSAMCVEFCEPKAIRIKEKS